MEVCSVYTAVWITYWPLLIRMNRYSDWWLLTTVDYFADYYRCWYNCKGVMWFVVFLCRTQKLDHLTLTHPVPPLLNPQTLLVSASSLSSPPGPPLCLSLFPCPVFTPLLMLSYYVCLWCGFIMNQSISHENPSIKGLRVLDMLNVKWSALMVMDG